jgi:RNA-binding protein
VGAAGVTGRLVGAVDRALADHELVKVRIAGARGARQAVAEQLARRTGSALAGAVGHVAILYRPAAERERRKIALPSGDAAAADSSDPASRARRTRHTLRNRGVGSGG